MEETESGGVARERRGAMSQIREDRRRRRRRAGTLDESGPLGIFWISGIAVVGTLLMVTLVFWLLLGG